MNHVAGETKIKVVKLLEKILKNIIFASLKIFFPELSSKRHDIVLSRAFDAPWKTDVAFQESYKIASKFSLNDIQRLYTLWYVGKQQAGGDGDCLEIGTWRGGSSLIISKSIGDKTKKYFFDSFSGIPKIVGNDDENYVGGEHNGASKREVEELLNGSQIKNFSVIKGMFNNRYVKDLNINKIKLCHIDVDTYESTSTIFNVIEPLLSLNSVVVIDDYNIHKATGIKKFVEEIDTIKFRVINNFVGQALILKKQQDT